MLMLVSAKEMVERARMGGYAIPHININNLEWTRAALVAAQRLNSPIILATSMGAIKYMGGLKLIRDMVVNLIDHLGITVPVALHLDHGSYEVAIEAIKAGYTSIMYDGSHEPFEVNYERSKRLATLTNLLGISLECEVGTIGGVEDGIVGRGEIADVKQCGEIARLGISFLAAGIGNIHGVYPSDWVGLDFKTLREISRETGIGLVLHGGSGIPKEQIKEAIALGVAKINVNTELQIASAKELLDYVGSGRLVIGKTHDFRVFFKTAYEAMVRTVEEKIREFGSEGRA